MMDYPETPESVRARLNAIIQLCKTAKDGWRFTPPITRKAMRYLNDLRFQLLLTDGYQHDHVKLWRERDFEIGLLERDAKRAADYSIADARARYAAFRDGLINDAMVSA
jgi:hypothetical protein